MKLWKIICLCAMLSVLLVTGTACTAKIDGFVRDDRTPIDYLPVCAVELEVGAQETRTAQEWADLGINGIIRESGYENFRGEWKTQYYAVARLENGYYFFAPCEIKNNYSGNSMKNYDLRGAVVFGGIEAAEKAKDIRIGMTVKEVRRLLRDAVPAEERNYEGKIFVLSRHYLDDGSLLEIGYDKVGEDAVVTMMQIFLEDTRVSPRILPRDMTSMKR